MNTPIIALTIAFFTFHLSAVCSDQSVIQQKLISFIKDFKKPQQSDDFARLIQEHPEQLYKSIPYIYCPRDAKAATQNY